jgi:hypothetical protein
LRAGGSPVGTAKPLVSEGLPHHFAVTRGFFMLFYRAALPLSSRTLNYAAGIIRRHLKAIGSRWRKLDSVQLAEPALAADAVIDVAKGGFR